MAVSLRVFTDDESFASGGADLIAHFASEAIAARGRFTLVLAGGETPRRVYASLSSPPWRERIRWSEIHVFFGDERCVPPADPRSNYRMACETLLGLVPLSASNIHRIRGEAEPAAEAMRYEQEMTAFFGTPGPPAFDLILLGLGGDGHTASLFPGAAALRERQRRVVAHYVAATASWRVTLTVPTINAARQIAFFVAGSSKSQALWHVLRGPHQPETWPAQLIEPAAGGLHWLVDAAAAAQVRAS
jgi:6-phosphogluconolactonase